MDRTAKIIVAAVIIIAGAFLVYSKLAGWHVNQVETTIRHQKEICRDEVDKLKAQLDGLSKELEDLKSHGVSDDKLAEVFGEKQQPANPAVPETSVIKPEEKPQPDFAGVEERVRSFFDYLDRQPYVQSFGFEEGVFAQYQIAVKKLSSKLPVTIGEMSSLYDIVRNVAYFYRTLGKKRIMFIRQMLQNESEIIESVMRTFYRWYTMMDAEGKSSLPGRPSLENMYEYAAYFLNTLGGRSYLLRRNPKVRALTTYYCLLILDRSNEESLNSKGIDIRPFINSSTLEIKYQIGLMYQNEYLTRLSELAQKYAPH